MLIEFYRGQPLDPDQLEALRLHIESFDAIDVIDAELRGIVERNWPHLLTARGALMDVKARQREPRDIRRDVQ